METRTKACYVCRQIKQLNEFYKNCKSKDGYGVMCKYCTKSYNSKYKAEHKEQVKTYDKKKTESIKDRLKSDKSFKINYYTQNRLKDLLRRKTRNSIYFNFVDYTFDSLKQHFENLFTSEMNWGNYGEYWEVDHIIQKCRFKPLEYGDEQFQQCWALSNLRPLKVSDNRQRSR